MSTPSQHRLARDRRVMMGPVVLGLAIAPILSATTAGAAPPPGTPVLHQSAELVSTPLGTHDHQGQDVALSADGATLAVAGVAHGSRSAVVVYVRSGDSWITQTTLRSPLTRDGRHRAGARSIAISADGDTLAVADPAATVHVRHTKHRKVGSVVLFTRSGQTWQAAGRLRAPRKLEEGRFGLDVSLSGDGTRVLVGGSGQAYIADTDSRVVRRLPAPAGWADFGRSVGISPDGETVVVGAPGGGGPGPGGAFVLVDDPVDGWTQRWHLEPQPGQDGDRFGAAVAVDDADTVVVGAPSPPYGVSVFDRRGEALVRTARFTPQYAAQGHGLGSSVAVSADGSTVVAGAPSRSAAGGSIDNAGAGYRWVRSPGGWSWAGLLSVAHPNANERQGWSIAVSGDGRVVVTGAPGRTSPLLGRTGAAIVFSAVP